jgi:hypothetical protein
MAWAPLQKIVAESHWRIRGKPAFLKILGRLRLFLSSGKAGTCEPQQCWMHASRHGKHEQPVAKKQPCASLGMCLQ